MSEAATTTVTELTLAVGDVVEIAPTGVRLVVVEVRRRSGHGRSGHYARIGVATPPGVAVYRGELTPAERQKYTPPQAASGATGTDAAPTVPAGAAHGPEAAPEAGLRADRAG